MGVCSREKVKRTGADVAGKHAVPATHLLVWADCTLPLLKDYRPEAADSCRRMSERDPYVWKAIALCVTHGFDAAPLPCKNRGGPAPVGRKALLNINA